MPRLMLVFILFTKLLTSYGIQLQKLARVNNQTRISIGNVPLVTDAREVQACKSDNVAVVGACLDWQSVQSELHEVELGLEPTDPKFSFIDKMSAFRPRHKPLLWVHVHKAAGTTMCALAALNNEIIVAPNTNCNWQHFDGKCDNQPISCDERHRAFKKHAWTWGQIERGLNEEDICEGFLYGIMLREPVSLALSFADYENINITEDVHCIKAQLKVASMFGKGVQKILQHRFCRQMWKQGRQKSWRIADNFMIRTLLGSRVTSVLPGRITEDHATEVIELLSKFHLVAVLDEPASFGPAVLSEKLSWVRFSAHRNDHGGHNVSVVGSAVQSGALSADDLTYLTELNRMDRIVYNYFKKSVR